MSLILDGTNGLSDVDGTAATPAIRGTDTNTGIFFPAADTIAFSEGGVESMRIDSSGNVGIGTSSPNQRLESTGTIRVSRAGTPTTFMEFFGGDGSIDPRINVPSGFGIPFNVGGTERARIDSSGNLLIALTATGTPAVGYIFNTNGFLQIGRASGAAQSTIGFYNGSTFVGEVRTSTVATTYATSSDYRLKENVSPMIGALDKLSQLKPCTYTWKADGSAGEGFIAHELQSVVPDCVTGEKDAVDSEGNPQYQGIDTSFLVATLTAALQEAHGLIKDLQTRVETLEAK